jgi:hypothetical protein
MHMQDAADERIFPCIEFDTAGQEFNHMSLRREVTNLLNIGQKLAHSPIAVLHLLFLHLL